MSYLDSRGVSVIIAFNRECASIYITPSFRVNQDESR